MDKIGAHAPFGSGSHFSFVSRAASSEGIFRKDGLRTRKICEHKIVARSAQIALNKNRKS